MLLLTPQQYFHLKAAFFQGKLLKKCQNLKKNIEKIIKTTLINKNGLQKDNLSQWGETRGGEVL